VGVRKREGGAGGRDDAADEAKLKWATAEVSADGTSPIEARTG
jgi:hypothetical protein